MSFLPVDNQDRANTTTQASGKLQAEDEKNRSTGIEWLQGGDDDFDEFDDP